MLRLYVQMVNMWHRLSEEEKGLTAIEYGVFAAFVVLAISAVAFFVGPKIAAWIQTAICEIMGGGSGRNGC